MLGEVGRAFTNPAFGLRNDLAGREGGNLPVSLGGGTSLPLALVADTSLADLLGPGQGMGRKTFLRQRRRHRAKVSTTAPDKHRG